MSLKRILRITLMFWSLFFMFQGFCQSDPPVVTAIGNQIYCPQTQQNIVTSFNIADTDSNSTEAFYIQVSSGYILGEDQLILSGSHPNVTSNWNAAQAKLTLSPASGSTILYTDIINAVYDVVFISSNLSVGPKTFSLTVGEANFLDGHYYDFVPLYAVPWTTAKANAEAMSYYGLQGYLATITNADEAQICGELSPGTGWIGASDVESEGVWKWVTGPEEGTIFWNGNQNGSAPAGMYSNWNAGEPNNSGNNEDYAHITDVSVTDNPGSWNDLPDSTAGQPPQYTATGFVVEYGGMPGDPELSISASTSFSPAEILSTTPSTSCENEAANLEATSNTTDVLWFDDEFGGNLLHSGNTYNPVLSSNVTFWVLASENGCQTGTRVAVNANVNPSESTTFTPIDSICVGDPNPLPATDINGVTGTWSPAFDPNTTTTYTFTPDAGQCAATVDMTIGITPLTIPDYTQISDVCIGTSLTIPTTSNNGIIGTWSPAFDPNTTTTYTFTPNAGQCAATVDMTIGITPLTTPDFMPIADVCIGTSLTIPTTSNNGITGTWSPAFDPTTTTLYTFTPNPNQCANQTTMTIGIIPLTIPDFTPITDVCIGTSLTIPTTSNNGITGTWSPAFDPNTTTTYTFTPDAGQCAATVDMTIGITPLTIPDYTQISDVCIGTSLTIPTTSNNGIIGTWSPAFDPNTTTTYTFTPNAGQCAATVDMTIGITPLTTPDFMPIADVCIGTSLTIPTTSNNGITGTWSPAFDPTTTTLYTFTPNPNQCANHTTMTIGITPETTSTFSPIAPICEGTNIVLPTASNEGFTGAWSPAFDPNTTTTYTFTPDAGQCASGTTLTVGIIPTVTPTFTPIDPICFGDAIGPLPTTSNNGINGTWFPTTIDNTTTTTYIFTPNGGNCVENTTLEVIVLQQITPTFQIDDICIGETIPSLPNFSQEGISGTWSPAINNLATTTYTFTPDPGQCANSTTETIQVNLISTLAIITENTSAPFESNQIVEVTVTGGSGNYEYQLDGGNWQTSSIFQNVVGCQDHIVKVRDAEGCSNEPESAVTILSYPKFFTPNGDGFNDFWNIKCLRNSTGLVSIFDRFGKLLKQFKTTGSGWNGTYNNNLMPTSDYWFLVTYYDENGIEKEFRSHFTLRR